ncbi:hypothetical protein BYT27DRAFT_7317211 [Phlegmacium glaucopus]|nr:hypothetical protein BYT27DRAFT_7317211 [Phlegmacium glaucopus]
MDVSSWGQYTTSFLLQIKMKGLNLTFLSDSWLIPFAFSCISLSLQIIHIILHWTNTFRKPGSGFVETELPLVDTMATTFSHSLNNKVKNHGGWTIYLFMVARLFGCLALFALSVKSLLACRGNQPGIVDRLDTHFKHLFIWCPEAFMTVTFFYSSVMAIVSVTVKDWSVSATRYNILVLLSVFGVYLYRDIWPLASIHRRTERSPGRPYALGQIQYRYVDSRDHPTVYSSSICAS